MNDNPVSEGGRIYWYIRNPAPQTAGECSRHFAVCLFDHIGAYYAGYEYEDFKPGQVLPIAVELTNKGNTTVEKHPEVTADI